MAEQAWTFGDDELRDILKRILRATMVSDDAVNVALEPLNTRGTFGDAYLLTCGLMTVIKRSFGSLLHCPEHGPGSGCGIVGFTLMEIGSDGRPVLDGDGKVSTHSVTPEIEASAPDVIAYMRMLTAEVNEDSDTSCAVWHAAVEGGFAPEVFYRAIGDAGRALRVLAVRQ